MKLYQVISELVSDEYTLEEIALIGLLKDIMVKYELEDKFSDVDDYLYSNVELFRQHCAELSAELTDAEYLDLLLYTLLSNKDS